MTDPIDFKDKSKSYLSMGKQYLVKLNEDKNMTDPIQQIEERWKEVILPGDPDFDDVEELSIKAQHDIQNLLKLIKAYEIIMDRSFVGTGEMMEVKKEIFGEK